MKVGLTGHQDLGSKADINWVKTSLARQIEYPELTAGVQSLAIGADQLYASLLRQAHKPYTVIIPCTRYETTFKAAEDLAQYLQLLESAAEVISLPFDEPSEQAFLAAGKKMVELSDYVLAVWDGLPAKGRGGTADIVQYARQLRKQVVHLNPDTHQILHI